MPINFRLLISFIIFDVIGETNMKKILLSASILLASLSLLAQRTLPPHILNAIPEKFTVTSQLFVKQAFMARVQIDLTVPNIYACNDGLKGDCTIGVIITAYDETQKEYVEMMENRVPFKTRLPNASNHKPSADPNNQLVAYSETKVVQFLEGSAAYYTQNNSCIMDQHTDYESVSLKSLQGSTARSIEIVIYGGISAEEALSYVKELYQKLSSINYFAYVTLPESGALLAISKPD
jgi:hypothetical protein